MKWAKSRNNCLNCQTDERKHVGRGLCTLCYRLTIKKNTAESWEFDQQSILEGYPFRKYPLEHRSFDRFKRNVIRHFEERLEYIKHRGAKLKGDVDGLDLEYGFAYVARLAGSKERNLFHGTCGWFEMIFKTPEQRQALLRIIDKIEKSAHRDIPLSSLLLVYD